MFLINLLQHLATSLKIKEELIMKLDGTYTFNAPRDIVWEALLDPR